MTKPTEHQVDRLYERMTPKERAKLRIAWWREDRADDPALRKATPDYQLDELNRYVYAVMETHDALLVMAYWLDGRVETLGARLGMVSAFGLWAISSDRLRWAAEWDFAEVLTESQRARRLTEHRAQRFPVLDCSHLLQDLDLETDEEIEEDRKRWEKRIRQATKKGELRAVKGGIAYGELMDWAGQEVAVLASVGVHVAVVPDSLAEYAATANAARAKLQALAKEAPLERDASEPNRWEKLRADVLRSIARDLGECEVTLRSLEEVAAWVAEDFDGEEVLHPCVRETLDAIAGEIEVQVERLGQDGWEVELPAVGDEQMVAKMKRRIAAAI